MKNPVFQLSEDIANVETDQAFWDICEQALRDIGITGFGFGLVPYASDAEINGFSKAGFFKHTYPDEWSSVFAQTSTLDQDITIELIIGGTSIALWNDSTLLEHASSEQINSDSVEKDLGMEFGVSLALARNGAGSAISGIGLWAGDVKSDDDFSCYWQEYRTQIQQIIHILVEGLRKSHAGLLVALTRRERDCLTYLAVGLRPVDICWKLKISEKTLEKYIKSAKDKLNARTRDHAVAKALVLNLIQP